ncbi:hypothetical protein JVU11DRAFT_4901 [Chiua virens]|nr:hypothetical protein JVU11DRAFT_4901 [Chiua virens]
MDNHLRKVTARVDLSARHQSRSRPASPTKHSLSPHTKPNATVRKPASSSTLSATKASNVSPSASRPGSPLRPSRALPNGSESNSSSKARITVRPTSRPRTSPVLSNSTGLESRQRALTTASAKLKLLPSEDRPRSGSVVALHHALSISDLNAYSPTFSQPQRSADSPLQDMERPALPPIKIKSKVTGFVKSASANPADALSRSRSPPYATTRPIHTRARTPSITTSFSLNDPTPSVFYPITTASPAANPHRYVPHRAPSPARILSIPFVFERAFFCKEIALDLQGGPDLGSPAPTFAPNICTFHLF